MFHFFCVIMINCLKMPEKVKLLIRMFMKNRSPMQIIKKKVLSAIRNSNADNEKSTSAIRNSLKKHDTLYSGDHASL